MDSKKFLAFFLIAFMISAGCATTKETAPQSAGPAISTTQATGRITSAPPQYTGPKKRIAVAKFDAIGTFTSQYGSWDIGGGLAAQLTTELTNSGRFIVVERAELASVLHEQQLGMQKIVSQETAAQVGRVLGAQILIKGSVTEFDQKAGGGGLRLGVGTGAFGGALGRQTTEGIVGMDIRVIDTTTGQVLQSHQAEAKISQHGVSADVNWRQINFGGDKFDKTVLGQATREAIEKAVAFIIQAMEPVPWTGRVVEINGDQVYINAGAAAGLKEGDVFMVTSVVRELTDPDSGALLAYEEAKLGEVEVVSVQEKFSVARMHAQFQTKRGDLVRLSGQHAAQTPASRN